VTQPRQVLPAKCYLLTRRCTQRQFLLRPDKETNNSFVYCLAEAAQRFEIELIAAQQMSNHHHTVLFDRHARVNEFTAHFHKMLAKCQNAHRGRWENMWATEPPSLVSLEDPSDVIDKIVYTAANPVLDNLVDRVDHWPGARLVRAMLQQEPLHAHRPRHFFREHGSMPATIALGFTVPREFGDAVTFIEQLRVKILETEHAQTRKRTETATRILGRSAVLRQSWRDSPASREPRRNLRPRVAARSKWSRIAALERNSEFLSAYRVARAAWLIGRPIPFPPGTYWLVRFANAPVLDFFN
jgi:putative transposase